MNQPADATVAKRESLALLGHVAAGAIAGPLLALLFGVTTSGTLVPLAIGGAAAGLVLRLTHRWEQGSRWVRRARWVVAGATAGVALGAGGLFVARVTVMSVAGSALVGAVALGLARLQLEPPSLDAAPRSRGEAILRWALVLGILGSLVALAFLAGTV